MFKMQVYMDDGYKWAVNIDKKYFVTVNQDKLIGLCYK